MTSQRATILGSVLGALLIALLFWHASGICEQSYQLATGDGYVSDEVIVCIIPIIPGALIHQYLLFGIDNMVLFWFSYSIPYLLFGLLFGWILTRIRIHIKTY